MYNAYIIYVNSFYNLNPLPVLFYVTFSISFENRFNKTEAFFPLM